VKCIEAGLDSLPDSPGMQVLIASHNEINITRKMFHVFQSLVMLYLNHNNIQHLPFGDDGAFQTNGLLSVLDLSWNSIGFLGEDTFRGLTNLSKLFLDGNPILSIGNRAFYDLTSLEQLNISSLSINTVATSAFSRLNIEYLDMSNNDIRYVGDEMFRTLSSLKHLDLRNNKIVFHASFRNLPLFQDMTYVGGDEWNFCCLAQRVAMCKVPVNIYMHCEDLLTSSVLKSSMWLMSLFSLSGNIFVLIYRWTLMKLQTTSSAQNLMLLNLAFVDILMPTYLTSISIADITFHGVYVIKEKLWRGSIMCTTLGFFASFSAQLSLFTVVFLSGFHLYVIGYRKSMAGIDQKSIIIVCVVSWLVTILLSALPLIELERTETGLCLLFNFGSARYTGWYCSVVYIILSLTCLVASVVVSIKMIIVIYTSAQNVRKTGSVSGGSNKNKTFVLLFLQLACNFICWIPLEVAMMMSLAGTKIHPDVNSWLIVFILPFNSLTNPLMYTIRVVAFSNKPPKSPNVKRA